MYFAEPDNEYLLFKIASAFTFFKCLVQRAVGKDKEKAVSHGDDICTLNCASNDNKHVMCMWS